MRDVSRDRDRDGRKQRHPCRSPVGIGSLRPSYLQFTLALTCGLIRKLHEIDDEGDSPMLFGNFI